MSIFSRLFGSPDEGAGREGTDGAARIGRAGTDGAARASARADASPADRAGAPPPSDPRPRKDDESRAEPLVLGASIDDSFPKAEEVTTPMELRASHIVPLGKVAPAPRVEGLTHLDDLSPAAPRAEPPSLVVSDSPPAASMMPVLPRNTVTSLAVATATRRFAAPAPQGPLPASGGRTLALGSLTPASGVAKTTMTGGLTLHPRRGPTEPVGSGPAVGSPAPGVAPRGEQGSVSDALPTDSAVDEALDRLFPSPGGAVAARPSEVREGTTTSADRDALRATFEALATGHVLPIRNLMIEVRYGHALTSWIAVTRPAIRTLREMADRIEHPELVAALDVFATALDAAAASGDGAVTGATKEKLLAAYAPLVERLPQAFELEGERDRREPIIVQGLLQQVPGLEPLMIERLCAAGLARLEALFEVTVDDLAAVAALPPAVAAELVARIHEFRRRTPASLASPDVATTRRELESLLPALVAQNGTFEHAATGWTNESRAAKRAARRDREVTYLQIKVALARLGDIDFLLRLEKLPFAARAVELQRYLREATSTATLVAKAARSNGPRAGAHGVSSTASADT